MKKNNLNISVIGLGSIGARHAKSLISLKKKLNIKDIKCFDTNIKRAEKFSRENKQAKICTNLKETVQNSQIIFICVPTSLHLPIWKKIKKFGKFHYFIEKPLSHDLKNCREFIKFQKNNKKKAVVGYALRFYDLMIKTKKLLGKGLVGKILNVRAESGFYLPFWHPWEDYKSFYMSSKKGGGGALLDDSHEIDYLIWMFGDIKYVQGVYSTISNLKITSDDYTSMILEFKNGITGEVHFDLLQPDESRYLKVIGSKGVMVADLIKNEIRYNTIENLKWKFIRFKKNHPKYFRNQQLSAFNYFSNKKNKSVSAEEAFKTMQVIEAVRLSSKSGTRIKLPL